MVGLVGQASAARLLPRVRPVEERHTRALTREKIRRPRPGGARANDGDVKCHLRTVIHYGPMIDVDAARFTVGVFPDVAWAQKGLSALRAAGLPPAGLSMVAKESPEVASLIEQTLGTAGERLDIAGTGVVLARGPLVAALQGTSGDLPRLGLSGTMRRVGFQPHDGRIFETLTARGGVLVAISSEPRAADALAILLSYGGGNAAIGAWTGRV